MTEIGLLIILFVFIVFAAGIIIMMTFDKKFQERSEARKLEETIRYLEREEGLKNGDDIR